MLTGAPQLRDLAAMQTSGRLALLETLIGVFQAAFGRINFQLISESPTINAQAIVLGGSPSVRIYGGLAFHPLLGSDAITFALLHETGHHLAPGCRQPWNPSIACECVADRWAANDGSEILERTTGHRLNARKAMESLETVVEHAYDQEDRNAETGSRWQDSRTCWALSWSKRKKVISEKTTTPVGPFCPLADLVLSKSYSPNTGRR